MFALLRDSFGLLAPAAVAAEPLVEFGVEAVAQIVVQRIQLALSAVHFFGAMQREQRFPMRSATPERSIAERLAKSLRAQLASQRGGELTADHRRAHMTGMAATPRGGTCLQPDHSSDGLVR